jgi:hypothetical protein
MTNSHSHVWNAPSALSARPGSEFPLSNGVSAPDRPALDRSALSAAPTIDRVNILGVGAMPSILARLRERSSGGARNGNGNTFASFRCTDW